MFTMPISEKWERDVPLGRSQDKPVQFTSENWGLMRKPVAPAFSLNA